ncbi:uncharacterized protein LOC124308991 [Neodiprion virginianus]|uniref:uncharacterized protein LOC124187127 n=1 Tax=Neodiprion fabricii TaxID=2872261 RepID=UPI001ED941F7|nr:uncharacterized protein LOC124187127 [Neodiprion fabricii]XP_046628144.1 uncharacterized protein LOC124308991 [Neodiprion virginianus]
MQRSVKKHTKSIDQHRSINRNTRDVIMGIFVYAVAFLLALVGSGFAAPQFIANPETPYAHPAVLINSHMESQLPEELRNPFYKNPRIANSLAKESWFGNKEMQVIEREAEKIPREKIFSVLHNAGLARRK